MRAIASYDDLRLMLSAILDTGERHHTSPSTESVNPQVDSRLKTLIYLSRFVVDAIANAV